jgi:hypothetical protein
VVDLRTTSSDQAAVERIDGETTRRLRALPLRISRDRIAIAFDRVPTTRDIAELQTASGCAVAWVLATPAELTRSIDRSHRALKDVGTFVPAFETGEAARAGTAAAPVASTKPTRRSSRS